MASEMKCNATVPLLSAKKLIQCKDSVPILSWQNSHQTKFHQMLYKMLFAICDFVGPDAVNSSPPSATYMR